MPSLYPGAFDAFTNPVPGDALAGHAAQHALLNDAVAALQRRVGSTDSADPASLVYQLRAGAVPSTDADNRLTTGTDGGLFVPEITADPLAYYILSKA